MEHRWGRRDPVDVDVRIFAHPASAGWGRLRDISISGGFIQTGLRVATLSTLCVTMPATRYRGELTLRAIVARSDASGVGVEWFDDDSEIVAALRQELAPRSVRVRVADDLRI
jgi:uncharacterized protein YjdB